MMSDFGKLVLYVFVAAIVLLALSFALGWIAWPFDLGSRQNVEEQFRTGYELNESLQGTAQAVCTTEKAFNSETDANLKSQRQSQLLAYETNYARLSADYDAWSRNIFEGGIVRPADLSARAPSLSEMKTQVCVP
jgi:hypothetical protein